MRRYCGDGRRQTIIRMIWEAKYGLPQPIMPQNIEALVQSEANKNLWTSDEAEQYKYELLKTLTLEEYIPIFIEFDNRGRPCTWRLLWTSLRCGWARTN